MDFYEIDALLTQEERDFRDRIRKFVEDECLPIIADSFDKGDFPMEVIPRLSALGLFGLHVEGFGCRKVSATMYGLACRELGRCDSGLRAMVSVQNSLVMDPIYRLGSKMQKEKWLPPLSRGEVIGCFGLSEPAGGSDPANMGTHAERSGDGFLLNGEKMWITNGSIAHVALIWAKTQEGIRGFLVETGIPGFQVSRIQKKFAYRTSPTSLLVFKNCLVPAESLLPEARGLKDILHCLNYARFGVACGTLGSAVACFEAAKKFALNREAFHKPIASFQLIQKQLVDMAVEITKAQALTYRLGRLMDEGRALHPHISMAKLNNVREAMKIARTAREILGARGILADHQVIRHLSDLEAVSTLEGTENMHTLIIGQDLTKISAFQ